MFRYVVASFMPLSAPALAQQSAPEIPDDAVQGALKLPANLYRGKAAGVARPNENTLCVTEILNWRMQKLLLHPAGIHTAY